MESLPIKISLPESFFSEEERCGYRVTHQTKLLWAILLDLLVEFDRVCKLHQIRYILDLCSLRELYWASNKAVWAEQLQQNAFEKFESLATSYNDKHQKRVGNVTLLPLRPDKKLFPKELFDDITDYQFEEFSFPGPRDYDTYLTGLYDNWREFVVGEELHGGLKLDFRNSYTTYFKEETESERLLSNAISMLNSQKEKAEIQLAETKYALSVSQKDVAYLTKKRRKKDLEFRFTALLASILLISIVSLFFIK